MKKAAKEGRVMGNTLVYIGTYTDPILFGSGDVFQGKGEGIYCFELDDGSGALEPRHITGGVANPSYLALDPRRRFLYAVNELKTFEGKPSGTISAFAVEPGSGRLRFLNKKLTRGTDPCHVAVDGAGKNVFVANFMSGSVCVLPIQADGSLGDASTFIQHEGSSVDPIRQSGPHAHSTVLDPANRFAFVPDLGLDRVMSYRIDAGGGTMRENEPPWLDAKPGAGPRHLAFHPDGLHAYIINELDSTVVSTVYDPVHGRLRAIQTLSTLPADFAGISACADIDVSPQGDLVFASNRGHDSIAIFGVDRSSGELALGGHQSAGGKVPRSFGIDPTGTFLLVANQSSDSIVSFRIDRTDRRLLPTGQLTHVPSPTCVKFSRRIPA
jgi:6-phosphogluconolactonase